MDGSEYRYNCRYCSTNDSIFKVEEDLFINSHFSREENLIDSAIKPLISGNAREAIEKLPDIVF